jgi:II/X family phage/plasmid replication protein
MIDWVTANIPFSHAPLNGGAVVKVTPDGDIEWETPCRVKVAGSHSQSITVRSQGSDGQGRASELVISGNPSKYLQGHNVFGSDDLRGLVTDTFLMICSVLGIDAPAATLSALHGGDYRLTRVDVNYMYSLGTQGNVKTWLRAAEYKSKTRHGRPASKAGTLYWGKHSRRWSLKAYSKYEEIHAPGDHKLPDAFHSTPIKDFAEDKLRIELTLRAKLLDEIDYSVAKKWRLDTPSKLFGDYIKRIEMNEQIALSTDLINELPTKVRSTYISWKEGYNPRDILSKPTFYRHRKILLDHGIDINLAVEKIDRSNVVPLVKVLEAKPADIPHWAYQRGLIHNSNLRSVSNG